MEVEVEEGEEKRRARAGEAGAGREDYLPRGAGVPLWTI